MPEAIISISIVTGNLPVVVPHLVSQGLFSPLPPAGKEENMMEKLQGQGKVSENTHQSLSHTQSRFHVGKSTLWPIEIEPDSKKKKKKQLTENTSTTPLLPRFDFTPSFPAPPPAAQGWKCRLWPAPHGRSFPSSPHHTHHRLCRAARGSIPGIQSTPQPEAHRALSSAGAPEAPQGAERLGSA